MASRSVPFRSEAERRKWVQLFQEGNISKEQLEARVNATGSGPLPERSKPRHHSVGVSRAPDAAKIGKQRY